MKHLALLGAFVALALALPVQAANPIDEVLGALRRTFRGEATPPPGFPRAAPAPEWQAWVAEGDEGEGGVLYAQGRSLAGARDVQACAGCHGSGGVPEPGSPMPRLAGVSADYIAKQLADYRAGRRHHSVMQGVAGQLTDRDIGSVARLIATMPPAPPAGWPDPRFVRGKQLQENGDNTSALPACGNCHGPQGRGLDRLLPPLAGLPSSYLVDELMAWKSGRRANDTDGVMRSIAARLSDEDILELARYYSSIQ